MSQIFKEANNFFEQHKYQKAYDIYVTIAENEDNSKLDRAEAYFMMGQLSSIFFLSSNDKDAEINFYKKALELNPKHRIALFNSIILFKEDPELGYHADEKIFLESYEIAIEVLSEFTLDQKKMIKEKQDEYFKLKLNK